MARRRLPAFAPWALGIGALALFSHYGRDHLPWAFKYPRGQRLPLAREISDFMDWLVNDADLIFFTFKDFTRGVSWTLAQPLEFAGALFFGGFGAALPPLSWLALILILALAGRRARDWKLALLVGGCFLYLAVFGQWQSAMATLSSIVIAVPFGFAGGLLIGVAAYRRRWLEEAIRPALDLMQTMPVFSYLTPILFLFGFGPVAAMIATIIYAMPPMARVTILALKHSPPELLDLGRMTGCTPRQMMWKILAPSAKPMLTLGLNQVIMLSLNMVIIASMIGAGGLGFDVLTALRRLDIGGGVEAGIAIVALAIALDRLSQAFAHRRPAAVAPRGLLRSYPYTAAGVAFVVLCGLAGVALPAAQKYPQDWIVTTGGFWNGLVEYINLNFYGHLEAAKTFFLLNVLVPFKRFLLALPWLGVVALLAACGWRLGGVRLAALCGALSALIAAFGLWPQAMITVYLCGLSVLAACLIGMPIGIAAAERERLWRVVRVIVDTLQTLPSFVYLMPVVMLFRVGDFAAIIAVIAYSVAPAIRYTHHGLRAVDPRLIEAAAVCGCTRAQILWKVKMKLALPQILLGINQTVMLAISMVVITALVGTRDLGQEVYIALTKADAGRGIVAGLAVAFVAIIADRLITASARRLRTRFGLAESGAGL